MKMNKKEKWFFVIGTASLIAIIGIAGFYIGIDAGKDIAGLESDEEYLLGQLSTFRNFVTPSGPDDNVTIFLDYSEVTSLSPLGVSPAILHVYHTDSGSGFPAYYKLTMVWGEFTEIETVP